MDLRTARIRTGAVREFGRRGGRSPVMRNTTAAAVVVVAVVTMSVMLGRSTTTTERVVDLFAPCMKRVHHGAFLARRTQDCGLSN